MALYRRGKIWWVNIWRNGKHIQVSTKLTDKRMARAVEQALCLAGEAVDGSGKRLLVPTKNDEGKKRGLIQGLLEAVYGDDGDRTRLDSVWTEYEDVVKVRCLKIKERTLSEKRTDYEAFVNWAKGEGVVSLDGVTSSVAKKYSLKLATRCKDKRRSNIVRSISSIWNAILPSHPGITNPWPQVSPTIDARKTTKDGFTKEQEAKVLEAAKLVHPQWYVACIIGRTTGMRYGDVCRLTRGNFDIENGLLNYKPMKTADSSRVEITLPMPSALSKVIREWIAGHPNMTPHDRLLPWLKERAPKGDKRFRSVLEKAGVDHMRYSFHSWRHVAETRLCEAGASLDVRKKILGHTTDVMADRYNHADLTKEMKSALELASA